MFLLFQTPEELSKETLADQIGAPVHGVLDKVNYYTAIEQWGHARFGEAWSGYKSLRDFPVNIVWGTKR